MTLGWQQQAAAPPTTGYAPPPFPKSLSPLLQSTQSKSILAVSNKATEWIHWQLPDSLSIGSKQSGCSKITVKVHRQEASLSSPREDGFHVSFQRVLSSFPHTFSTAKTVLLSLNLFTRCLSKPHTKVYDIIWYHRKPFPSTPTSWDMLTFKIFKQAFTHCTLQTGFHTSHSPNRLSHSPLRLSHFTLSKQAFTLSSQAFTLHTLQTDFHSLHTGFYTLHPGFHTSLSTQAFTSHTPQTGFHTSQTGAQTSSLSRANSLRSPMLAAHIPTTILAVKDNGLGSVSAGMWKG